MTKPPLHPQFIPLTPPFHPQRSGMGPITLPHMSPHRPIRRQAGHTCAKLLALDRPHERPQRGPCSSVEQLSLSVASSRPCRVEHIPHPFLAPQLLYVYDKTRAIANSHSCRRVGEATAAIVASVPGGKGGCGLGGLADGRLQGWGR